MNQTAVLSKEPKAGRLCQNPFLDRTRVDASKDSGTVPEGDCPPDKGFQPLEPFLDGSVVIPSPGVTGNTALCPFPWPAFGRKVSFSRGVWDSQHQDGAQVRHVGQEAALSFKKRLHIPQPACVAILDPTGQRILAKLKGRAGSHPHRLKPQLKGFFFDPLG